MRLHLVEAVACAAILSSASVVGAAQASATRVRIQPRAVHRASPASLGSVARDLLVCVSMTPGLSVVDYARLRSVPLIDALDAADQLLDMGVLVR